MHDANGNSLKVGDEVMIPAIITELQPGDEYCNVSLKSTNGRRPDGLQESISAINTGVLVLVKSAKAAVVALLVTMVTMMTVVAEDVPTPPGWYPIPPGVKMPIPDDAATAFPVGIVMDEEPAAKPAKPAKASYSGSDDALDEVNAYRAKRGLPPFKRDEGLTQAALKAATLRARSLINGHLDSDFACLPSGCTADAAGCGALDDSWGWGTCCMDDNYSHAGAAWVRGSDGKRYMHLFCRNDGRTSAPSGTISVGEQSSACSGGSCGSSVSYRPSLLRRRR